MRVEWQEIHGLGLREAEIHQDERGEFTKLWSGESTDVIARQVCTALNTRRGTIRGMHLQVPPSEERKLVWCLAGAIWDVVVDARPASPTYGDWAAVELRAELRQVLDVPRGLAHGYQALTDHALVGYVIDGVHDPTRARTLAWDDPAIGVAWPLEATVLSPADRDGKPWPLS